MDINKMTITELKAVLFDISQEIQQKQNAYNQVAQKLQEEVNKQNETTKADKKGK